MRMVVLFSGTVGAEEADDFAVRDGKGKILNCRPAAVIFGEVIHLNHRRSIRFKFGHYRAFHRRHA